MGFPYGSPLVGSSWTMATPASPSPSESTLLQDAHSSSRSLGSSTPVTSLSQTSIINDDGFLKDLSNYIGLGCLCVDGVFEEDGGISASGDGPGWVEISATLQSNSNLSSALGSNVLKLLSAGWIRLFMDLSQPHNCTIVRVYLLPQDIGRRFIDRTSRALRSSLQKLIAEIDTCPETWSGAYTPKNYIDFDAWTLGYDNSIFFLFNNLPSPAPSPEKIKDRFTRRVVRELLEPTLLGSSDSGIPFRGFKSTLYPYQARSAALMIQREAAPDLQLDPRLEVRRTPAGQTFYYGAKDGAFLLHPRYYESNRGGILAETMGYGKTMICLAVILATKYHMPKVPPHHQQPPPLREHVASLTTMAAATISRLSLPWKSFFERREEEEGEFNLACLHELESAVPKYEISVEPARFNRKTTTPPPKRMRLCSGTIIVVPRNLLHQWRSEIDKHLIEGALKVLVMDAPRDPLPCATELATYDVVLFSRTRFEQEIKDGSDDQGRRTPNGQTLSCRCPYIGSTRIRDCSCLQVDDLYKSPLTELHWLRIIVDEGHSFSSSSSNAVLVSKLIEAERRWVVSGTPAPGMLGVELDLATAYDADRADSGMLRDSMMEERRKFDPKEDVKSAKSLGALATHYLKVRPWTDSAVEGRVKWEDYIFRQGNASGFSSCLERVLEGLVVKTRPEDVERDIKLPKMTHKVVYLEPSFYDKMTANMFIQVLRANAITSERTDADYLFHKNNQKERYSLMKNLRQSNFTWTGFSEEDVHSTIDTSAKYLEKATISCSAEDRSLLAESAALVQHLLDSPGWLALSRTHEVGMFVEGWPDDSADAWAINGVKRPMMVGITQLLQAQDHVNRHLSTMNPAEGLQELGQEALSQASEIQSQEQEVKSRKSVSSADSLEKTGVPTSCLSGEPAAAKRFSASKMAGSPKSRRTSAVAGKPQETEEVAFAASPVLSKKRKLPIDTTTELPEDSQLRKTSILGTTSAKLSYLLDKVMRHQKEEKILIFYDGDNTAYYIAQCLELLHVKHLIYARTLNNTARSKYIVAFNEDPSIRVLLIDIACGALGLNLNVASVVLLVNPVNRPNIEAQAIKRAHRIGQTREVLVETLVLKGTIEEAIFERAKKMTRNEHAKAKELEDDDKITNIIQQATVIPVQPDEAFGYAQVARLETSQQIFGRKGRGDARIAGIDVETEAKSPTVKRKKSERSIQRPPRKPSARAKGKSKTESEGPLPPNLFGGPLMDIESTVVAVAPESSSSFTMPSLPVSLFGGPSTNAIDELLAATSSGAS